MSLEGLGWSVVSDFTVAWKPHGFLYCTLFDLSTLILIWAVAKSQPLNHKDRNHNTLQGTVAKPWVRCSKCTLNLQLPVDLLGIQDHSKEKSIYVCSLQCCLPTAGLGSIVGYGAEELVRNCMCLHGWKRLIYVRWLHCVINTGREPVILINRIGNLDGQWTISTNRPTKLWRALSRAADENFHALHIQVFTPK